MQQRIKEEGYALHRTPDFCLPFPAIISLLVFFKAAVMQQRIKEEGIQIQVIERLQQIEIAEHEIQRKHFELDSKIRKPAEAEKYRLETIAEAQRLKIIMEAEAEAEAVAIKGNNKIVLIAEYG